MAKPTIRFKGYTDDWEQRKLPEFVSFFNGLTYTPDDVEETGTLVLRSSNVKNGEIVDADNVYVNDKVVTSENVHEGDIIVVVRKGNLQVSFQRFKCLLLVMVLIRNILLQQVIPT